MSCPAYFNRFSPLSRSGVAPGRAWRWRGRSWKGTAAESTWPPRTPAPPLRSGCRSGSKPARPASWRDIWPEGHYDEGTGMTDVLGKAKVDRRPRVLCVDDEPAVLDSLRRQLYAEFAVVGAESGPEALALLRGDASFAVLVSDMRMPGMDGAAVLAQALSVRPDTVRILLTGQADMDDAIAAVNYGHVFRFLIKPCPRPVLVKALTDAVDQHRTIRDRKSVV